MSHFRRWHLALIPLPVVGWLLLAAYWLDERLPLGQGSEVRGSAVTPPAARRLAAGLIDAGLAVAAWWVLPPVPAWLLASAYLLFRDAGATPFGVGKRVLGLRSLGSQDAAIGYTQSFERNLPLLVPYVGLLVEAALVAAGVARLGDRLARTEVHSLDRRHSASMAS